jgi:hypothetical protein
MCQLNRIAAHGGHRAAVQEARSETLRRQQSGQFRLDGGLDQWSIMVRDGQAIKD